MKEIYEKLFHSLDNTKLGFSGKKLTIVAIVFCVLYLHYELVRLKDWGNYIIAVLGLDLGFIATLFGINVTDKKVNGDIGAK